MPDKINFDGLDEVTLSQKIKDIYDGKVPELGTQWGKAKMYFFDRVYNGVNPITSKLGNNEYNSILDFGSGYATVLDNITETYPEIETSKYDPNVDPFTVYPNQTYDLVLCNLVINLIRDQALRLKVLSQLEQLTNKHVFLSSVASSNKYILQHHSEIEKFFVIEEHNCNTLEKPAHLAGKIYMSYWLSKKE